MIKSGVKKEEYLEIKPYWINRLVLDADYPTNGQKEDFIDGYGQPYVVTKFKPFDIVSANNGYQKDCPNVKWVHKGIRIGTGREEWGAEPAKQYFILEIGELILARQPHQHRNHKQFKPI